MGKNWHDQQYAPTFFMNVLKNYKVFKIAMNTNLWYAFTRRNNTLIFFHSKFTLNLKVLDIIFSIFTKVGNLQN